MNLRERWEIRNSLLIRKSKQNNAKTEQLKLMFSEKYTNNFFEISTHR